LKVSKYFKFPFLFKNNYTSPFTFSILAQPGEIIGWHLYFKGFATASNLLPNPLAPLNGKNFTLEKVEGEKTMFGLALVAARW